MDEHKLHLTDSEFFSLEALEAKDTELQLRKVIESKEQLLCKKEIALMTFRIQDQKRAIEMHQQNMDSKDLARENLKVKREALVKRIRERLKLEEDCKFGYNPDTLEIILEG